MNARRLLLVAAALMMSCSQLQGQGQSAVPFLLIPSSPDANAWGHVATAVVSNNPIATITNPAQLGMFSLENHFATSLYTPKTKWLPTFGLEDLTYNVWAISAAYQLSDVLDLPFRFGIGGGYSRIRLNLGEFITTVPPFLRYNAVESSEQFSVGIGLDYFVQFGMGLNFKRISSFLGPQSEAKPSATDFGILVRASSSDIIKKAGGTPLYILEDLEPTVGVTFGYARTNLGDKPVTYPGISSASPLPRNATIGLSAELGLARTLNGALWKILAFTIAREAEDVLIGGDKKFQSGLGDIAFFRHVIEGRLSHNDPVKLHKGWQLALGEFIFLRGGSFSESPDFGNGNYTTSGFGIRMMGLFKIFAAISPSAAEDDVLSFLLRHVDVMYDHAEYTTDGPLGGTKFNALTLVIR